MKKKVGKGFTKILSVILAAAMVVSSAPETSLVVRAEGDPAVTQSSDIPIDDVADDGVNNEDGAVDADADTDGDADVVATPEEPVATVTSLDSDGSGIIDNRAALNATIKIDTVATGANFKVEYASSKAVLDAGAGDGYNTKSIYGGSSIDIPYDSYYKVSVVSLDSAKDMYSDDGVTLIGTGAVVASGQATGAVNVYVYAESASHSVAVTNSDSVEAKYKVVSGSVTAEDYDITTFDDDDFYTLGTAVNAIEHGQKLIVRVPQGTVVAGTAANSKVNDTDTQYDYYIVGSITADVTLIITKATTSKLTVTNTQDLNVWYAFSTKNLTTVAEMSSLNYTKIEKANNAYEVDGCERGTYVYLRTVADAAVVSSSSQTGLDSSDEYSYKNLGQLSSATTIEIAKKTHTATATVKTTVSNKDDATTTAGIFGTDVATVTVKKGNTSLINETGVSSGTFVKSDTVTVGVVADKTGYTITKVKINGEVVGTQAGNYVVKDTTKDLAVEVWGTVDVSIGAIKNVKDADAEVSTSSIQISDKKDGTYKTLATTDKLIKGKKYFLKVTDNTNEIKSVVITGGTTGIEKEEANIWSFTADAGMTDLTVTVDEITNTNRTTINVDAENATVQYLVGTDSDTGSWKTLPSGKSYIKCGDVSATSGAKFLFIKIVPNNKYIVNYDGNGKSDALAVTYDGKTTTLTSNSEIIKLGLTTPNSGNKTGFTNATEVNIKAEAELIENVYTFIPVKGLVYDIDSSTAEASKYIISYDENNPSAVVDVKVKEGETLRFNVTVDDDTDAVDYVKYNSTNNFATGSGAGTQLKYDKSAAYAYYYQTPSVANSSATVNTPETKFIKAAVTSAPLQTVTLDFTDATAIDELKAYVYDSTAPSGKKEGQVITTEDPKAYNISGTTATIKIIKGQDLTFTLADASEDSTVDYILYGKTDSSATKTKVDGSSQYTINNVTDDITIKVVGKINPEKANTINFALPKGVDVTSPTGFYDFEKGKTSYVTKSASQGFTLTAPTGYVFDSVVVGGEEKISENATLKGTYSGTATFESAPSIIDVSATIKAAPSDKEVYAEFSRIGGIDLDKNLSVVTDDTITYSKKSKKVLLEKDAQTLEFTVTVNAGYKMSSVKVDKNKSEVTTDDVDATLVSQSGRTYTYQVPKNLLEAGTTANSPVTITLTAVEDKMSVYVDSGMDVKPYGNSTSDELGNELSDAGSTGSTGSAQYGYKVPNGFTGIIKIESYQTLQQYGGKDEAGNLIWNDLVVDYNNQYIFTVDGKDLEFRIKPIEQPKYIVEATVNGADYVGKDDVIGSDTNINVKPGDVVVLAVSSTGASAASQKIDEIDAKKLGINSTIERDSTNNLKITVSAKDAGQSIVLPLTNTKTTGNDLTPTELATVTLNVSSYATSVALKDVTDADKAVAVASGSDVKVNAGSVHKYLVSAVPETVDMDLISISTKATRGTNPGQYTYEYDSTLKGYVLTYYGAATEGTQTFTFVGKDSAKTELAKISFTTQLPALKLSQFTMASAGTYYINVKLTPDASIEKADNLYYEVVTDPIAGADKPAKAVKKVVYIPVEFDEDGKPVATTAKIAVANFDATKDKVEVLDSIAWTYNVSGSIVLAKNAITSTTTQQSGFIKEGDAVTFTATTRNAYCEDNLKLTKKTTSAYTGQTVTVAQVQYSEKASNVSDAYFRVTDSNGMNVGFNGEINEAGEVIVQVPTNVKTGTYTVTVYAGANSEFGDSVHAAKASVKLKVKAGINHITSKVPSQFALGTKAVSFKISPVGYTGYTEKLTKASKQSFAYEIVDRNGNSLKNATSTYAKNIAANVTVSSNGKVTISPNFKLASTSENNTFKVKVTAKDFEGNTASETFPVEVTGSKIASIASIDLVKDNKTLGKGVTADKLDGAKIVVKDANGKDITSAVTLTSSSAKVKINPDTKKITLDGSVSSVKITAVTVDGGKKKLAQKFVVSKVTLSSLNVVPDNDTIVATGANTYTYKGSADTTPISFVMKDASGNAIRSEYCKLDVKVTGGKIVDKPAGAGFTVLATAAETKVTVTDKSVKKGISTTVKLTNTTFETSKAPKAKLQKGDKLYANGAYGQTLTYNVVTDCNAVQLVETARTKDLTGGLTDHVVEIKDGKFVLEFGTMGKKTGSITYAAIYGTLKDEVFTPQTAPATIKVSVSKLKKFVPNTSYTLNYLDGTSVKFTGTPEASLQSVQKVENDNVNGKPNNFAKYFDTDGTNIVLNVDYINNQIAAKKLKSIEDIPASDLTGWVQYKYSNAKAEVIDSVKVTINLSTENKTYAVQAQDVMKKSVVRTTGTMKLGNEKVAIQAVKSTTTGWTVEKGTSTGELNFTATNAKIGDNTVEFKVIPADSMYGASETVAKKNLDTNGITVVATIKVLDPSTATGKITVDETLTTVELDGTQSWSSSKKIGTYSTKEIVITGATKSVAKLNVNGLTINKVIKTENTPEGVDLTYSAGKLVIKVQADKLTAGGTLAVPVAIGFDNSTVTETVTFTVKAPKVLKGLSDIAADISTYLTSENQVLYDQAAAGGNATNITDDLKDGITDILTANAAAGVGIKTALVYTPATTVGDTTTDATAKLTIYSLADSTQTQDIEEVLNKGLSSKKAPQATAEAALDAVATKAMAYILNENEAKATINKYTAAGIDYIVASSSMNRFEVRQFLQSAITNDKYMLQIIDFKVVQTTKLERGYVSFKVAIVEKGKVATEAVSVKADLKSWAEIKAEEAASAQ